MDSEVRTTRRLIGMSHDSIDWLLIDIFIISCGIIIIVMMVDRRGIDVQDCSLAVVVVLVVVGSGGGDSFIVVVVVVVVVVVIVGGGDSVFVAAAVVDSIVVRVQ